MTGRRITLTFDNGPTPGVTDVVLDELASRDIKSTFFVIGDRLMAGNARELTERARSEGHWVGNHTLTHTVQFGDASADFAVGEIDGAQAAIGSLAHEDKLFRPYGGDGILSPHVFNQAAVDHLQDGGFTCVLWTCVPRDWDNLTGWPETAMAAVAQDDWTVVVVHDEAHWSLRQLPRFLDALEAADVEIRQDFPDSVLPIKRGELRLPMDHLTADAPVRP